ncbi:MAG: ADP-forming succinate--CoA ligase subunit beta [Pseudomonadota bacterium]
MNLHEYQGKQLFSQYHLPVPPGKIAATVEEALAAADALGGDAWMVKAQIHAGGRGKAGGVKYVRSQEKVAEITKDLLGKRLVTFQTDAKGQPVNQVLIAEPCDIKRELYVGAVLDRSTRRVVVMASTEGGVEIEKVAEETPEKIVRITMDPLLGILPYQARDIGFRFQLTAAQLKEFTHILIQLGKMFVERDLSVVEINPLIIDANDKLVCLDAKVVVDDNALFRQPELQRLRDPSQEDARENRAHEWGLNYIALDGDIACMVNGAGLAMATMDLIKLHGGNPANFLDVGGSATQARVTEAFKIILSDKKVKGILVNIFGGIVRCDMIADGIIAAVQEVGIKLAVVVRLEGNHAALGNKKLSGSGLTIIAAKNLTDAAEKIVNAVKTPA